MSAAPKFAAGAAQRGMLAKLHIARKELGLADEDYRAVLARTTGKSSAAGMTIAEMETALAEFARLGWKAAPAARPADPARPRTTRAADHPSARKARALWISLWQLGVVRNASEAALEAFARRQLGVERMQWADQAKCYRLIEALKAMATRAGWNQAEASPDAAFAAQVLLVRLIHRQCAILRDAGDPASADEMVAACRCHRAPGGAWRHLPMPALHRIADELGARVRAGAGKVA